MGIEDFNIDSDEHLEKVLIIGENEDSAEKLAKLLQMRGHQSCYAPSLQEASTLAVRELFDLIICDEQLSTDPPKTLIENLRSDQTLKRYPLLVIHPDAEAVKSLSSTDSDVEVQVLQAPLQASSFLVKVATQLRMRKFKTNQAGFEAQIATQNAELRDLTNRFKHELKEARKIQESILPKTLPKAYKTVFAAYCEPLEAVGGDLFDIFQIEKDLIGMFIGDVTGHGLPAAFIGAMTKMALTYAPTDSPVKMLSDINDRLSDVIPEGRFVTAVAAIYHAKTGHLEIARAGHPPPLIWRSETKNVECAEPKGLPLGILKGSAYQAFETTIGPGDKLLMVTDGITETADMDGKMIGVDGLLELFAEKALEFSVDKCIQEVLQAQKDYTDGRILKDDNTLMGFERLP